MAACEELTETRQSRPWWRWVLLGLISLGLALSAYLSWHYLTGGSVAGCGGGSACDDVLSSRWSSVAGVLPVSGLAAGAYLAMLVASFSLGSATPMSVRRLAWGAMLVLVGAATGSAVWFVIVQKWLIGAFCPYCMTEHITGLLLATLVVWQAPKQFDQISSTRVFGKLPVVGLAFAGVALAAVMALCQWTIVPRAVYRAGESQTGTQDTNVHDGPVIGSPDAPYVVTMLFDYKCPHCQQLHFMLGEVVRRYGGKLSIALCPTPLNRACNPYVPRDIDEFKNSCELAKIGLAVWFAKREAFPGFDQWMFTHETGDRWTPRSVDDARAKAIQLLGQQTFELALADPRVGRYLQSSIAIYGNAGAGPIPKLIYNSHWVTPQLTDADDLISILHDSLGVPNP